MEANALSGDLPLQPVGRLLLLDPLRPNRLIFLLLGGHQVLDVLCAGAAVLEPCVMDRRLALLSLYLYVQAFTAAQDSHIERSIHRERTHWAPKQCERAAVLWQHHHCKVGATLLTEARVAELLQEMVSLRPQRHQERQHMADQRANAVSIRGAPLLRQQHRLEADFKRAQQELRDLEQGRASKAQDVDDGETCMQEGRLEVGYLGERIDNEQQALKQAKRRQQAAQAEIVKRIPNRD